MYTVKLYSNTGYNPDNIPDSASLLGTAFVTKQAVDTVQNYVISSVRLSATFDDVKAVDYCQIGDFYYFVAGVTMSSRDVAILSLIPDYITSYGLSNLEFLDGITVRHHVDDDSFAKYTEDDPLLYCNEPLELVVGDTLFDDGSSQQSFVLATVDLQTAGSGTTYNSVTYTDPGGNEVTVPHLPELGTNQTTEFRMSDANGAKIFKIPGVVAYPLTSQQVIAGIQYCRDLAAETAIIDCYQIPSAYLNGTPPTDGVYGNVTQLPTISKAVGCGIWYANPTQMPRNARVLYGSYNKFGLMTMSGNRMEAKPEEIYDYGGALNVSPRVICVADPRPDGKPYFRFEYFNKETPVDRPATGDPTQVFLYLTKFWRNAIPGEAWYHVPLVYTSPSGIIQQQKYYDQSYKMNEYEHNQRGAVTSANMFSAYGDAIVGLASAGMGRGTSLPTQNNGMLNVNRPFSNRYDDYVNNRDSISSGFRNIVSSRAAHNLNDADYYNTRGKLDYEMGLLKNVVVPDIMFPYTSGTIRDFVGNGVIAYKYRPSQKDMALQDKLLTMYGYAVTDKLDISHFYNRQYFNYVQANSISIGNNIPHWWKAGIVAQLAGGVRVWHVAPDETHYDYNPIVTP